MAKFILVLCASFFICWVITVYAPSASHTAFHLSGVGISYIMIAFFAVFILGLKVVHGGK